MPQRSCGGQRPACRSWFSPFTRWVLPAKLPPFPKLLLTLTLTLTSLGLFQSHSVTWGSHFPPLSWHSLEGPGGIFIVLYWDAIFLWRPGHPGTWCKRRPGWPWTCSHLPASTSQVLGLKSFVPSASRDWRVSKAPSSFNSWYIFFYFGI